MDKTIAISSNDCSYQRSRCDRTEHVPAMSAWWGKLDFEKHDFSKLQIVPDEDGWCLIVRDRPGHWKRVAGPFSSRRVARSRLQVAIATQAEYWFGVMAWEAEQGLVESTPKYQAISPRKTR